MTGMMRGMRKRKKKEIRARIEELKQKEGRRKRQTGTIMRVKEEKI